MLCTSVQAKARQAARLEADDEDDDMPEELTANLAGKRAKRAVPAAEGLDEPNEDYEAAAAVAQAKKRRWAQCLFLLQAPLAAVQIKRAKRRRVQAKMVTTIS